MTDITRQIRKNFLSIIDSHTNEQLNKIPDGFNNNLIWNFAHIIVTQQLLTYGLSGLPLTLPTEMISSFRKGSRPDRHYSTEEIESFKQLATTTLDQFDVDRKSGTFKAFKPYSTSFGLSLASLDEAIAFNDVHEGLHLGYAMSLRKII